MDSDKYFEYLENGIQLISGQHLLANDYNINGHGIPYLTGPADFYQNRPQSDKYTLHPKACCQRGDILITVKGSGTGSLVIADQTYCISRQLMAVRGTKFDSHFVKYVLENFSEKLNSRSVGLIPGVGRDDILKIPIRITSLPKQKAIAAILSTWDEAIKKTERLIRSKSELILGVTQKVIGSQCKHWRHINIADMFTCVSEKKYPNEELLSVTQDQGVIPRSMLEGRVMSPQGSTEAYKLIVPGDFVVSLRSFQGGIEYSKYRGLISPAYTVLRPKVEINVEFYKKFFKTNLFIEKYLSISVIGIRDGKQISIPDLLITKIPLPSLQEQKKIVLLLDSYTSELDLLKELLNKYKMQKKALMQKLLTGKWRVNFKEEK
jgi:type I restriction enzyme S subunit